MTYVDEDWAEDHGYSRYRCPVCNKSFWSDSSPECCQPPADDDDEFEFDLTGQGDREPTDAELEEIENGIRS